MQLSSDILSQFAKVTKDETTTKQESIVYGTIIESNGEKYVQLDGSDLLTPMASTTNMSDGERVTVMIKNHMAVVTGNVTSPAVRDGDVDEKVSEVRTLVADKADIKDLNATNAEIEKLKAGSITVDKLEATNAEIDNLKAKDAAIENLVAKKADIENLNATNAEIDNLKAKDAAIENLVAKKADIETLNATYATIDFANIGQAAMEYFYATSGLIKDVVIDNGTITGNLVGVTIKGDIIEGNTVVADKLIIKGNDGLYYKLNTDGMKVEAEQTDYNSLNGSIITAKSITATKISVSDLVAFDATIGGFNITEKSIYSGVKASVDNTTTGIYLDKAGQIAFGDSKNFLKYYKDASGQYRLEISAASIKMGTSGTNVEEAIKNTQNAVDNLSIGGRNYLRNTGTLKKANWGFDNSSTSAYDIALGSVSENSDGSLDIVCRDSNVRWWLGHMTVTAGQKYTVSVRYKKKSGESPINFQYVYRDANYKEIAKPHYNSSVTQKTKVENGWTVLYDTLTVPDDATVAYVRLALRVGADNTAYTVNYTYQKPKFEAGNKATDWTPAPEDTDAAIDELSAALVVQAGEITANATKIETVNQSAASAQNAANAAQNAAAGAQGTANNAVTRVTTAEQRISAVEGAITSKVEKADFDVLGNKVSANTSAITQTANAIRSEVASSVSGLQTQIEQTDEQVLILAGQKIGGTNLARCAKDTIWVRYGSIDYERAESKSCRSGVAAVMSAWSGSHNEIRYNSNIDIEPGVYTVSFWCWHTGVNASVVIRPNIHADNSACDQYFDTLKFTPNANTPKKHSLQLNVTYTGRVRFRFVTMTPWSAGEVYFTDLKFENGNKATEWSPAPEDTDGAIQELTAELSVQAGLIAAKVEKTEFDELGRVVSAQGTQIALTDEQVLILAGRTVGGTNLVKLSAVTCSSVVGSTVNTSFGVISDVDETWYYRSRKMIALPAFSGDYCVAQFLEIPLKQGVEYTVSFNMWGGSGISGAVMTVNIWNEGRGTDFNMTQIGVVPNTPTRYQHTFTCPASDNGYHLRFLCFSGNNATIYLSDVKLEEGNTATAWSSSPEDPAASVNAGGVVRVDQSGVHMSGGTIEMETSDGEEYIHIKNSGIAASSLDAPNVARRYAGPTSLYVNPNATSAQMASGNYYRSLVDACAAVSGKYLDSSVTINVQGTSYGDAKLIGISGGAVTIQGSGNSLIGTMTIQDCASRVFLYGLTVSQPSTSTQTRAMWIANASYVAMESGVVISGNGGTYAMLIEWGSTVWLYGVELYNATYLMYCIYGTHVTGLGLKGGNCTYFAWANGAILKMSGSRPDGTFRRANAALTVPDDPGTLTVNAGSATPSTPVIQTASWNYLYTDSYAGKWGRPSNDAAQGVIQTDDSGNIAAIYGTIWFDAAAIRSALSGKTINQVSLRLHALVGYGRGVEVSVQLYGTNQAYSGRSGQPALTTSYGTIASIKPGNTAEIAIPTAAISDIVSGRIQALVLKSDDTALREGKTYSTNYARFAGSTSADGNTCPRLTVVYQ